MSDEKKAPEKGWREALRVAKEAAAAVRSSAEKVAAEVAESDVAERAKSATGRWVDRASELGTPAVERGSAALGAWVDAAGKASGRVVDNLATTETYGRARELAKETSERLRQTAEEVARSAQTLGEQARITLEALRKAEEAKSLTELSQIVTPVLERIAAHVDREADAIAFGTYVERGIGALELTGRELLYVRPPREGALRLGPGELRESELRGRVARLAMGVGASAYIACFYGPPALLTHPLRRRGSDVGVIIASALFFRASATASPDRGSGFLLALSPGLNIGIPIVGELSAYDIEERVVRRFALEPSATPLFELALAKAPDRDRLRRVAQSLG